MTPAPFNNLCLDCLMDEGDCDWHRGFRLLTASLVIGAALCRAFWLGDQNGLFYMDEGRNTWRPGCGRSAP